MSYKKPTILYESPRLMELNGTVVLEAQKVNPDAGNECYNGTGNWDTCICGAGWFNDCISGGTSAWGP